MIAIGRRERNKAERRQRVVAAARAVFAERGVSLATTREIAERADVGIGTLFSYAPDKEQLVALVVAEDLAAIGDAALAVVPLKGRLREQLLALFGPRYAYWAADPELARHAVKALFATRYSATGDHAIVSVQSRLGAQLRDLFSDAQRAGRLAVDVDANLVADIVLDIYLSEHRDWVAATKPEVSDGLARLATVLAFVLDRVELP